MIYNQFVPWKSPAPAGNGLCGITTEVEKCTNEGAFATGGCDPCKKGLLVVEQIVSFFFGNLQKARKC